MADDEQEAHEWNAAEDWGDNLRDEQVMIDHKEGVPRPSTLSGYTDTDKKQIAVLATRLVIAKIERGEIADTDEAIRAVMPEAVADAKQVLHAVWEFLS